MRRLKTEFLEKKEYYFDGVSEIAVSGNYAYVVSSGDDSVTVLDISYPDKPLLLSVIRDEVDGFTKLNGARTVAVSGDYLYVGAFMTTQ